MDIWQTMILGTVQGIAEWLPISSSGHLVLFEHWLGIKEAVIEFDIFLHLASFFVVIIFFRKQLRQVIQDFFAPKKFFHRSRRLWGWYIIISTIVTGVLGWMFYQQIELFRTPESVAGWLMVTTLLLLATIFRKEKGHFGFSHAIILGLMQGLAVLPGLSRSGAVIAMALILGLKKKDAFDYAFLLAIPAIGGSFLLSLNNFSWQWIYLSGFIVAFAVGYASLILLKKIIDSNYFHWFFVYTLLLSLLVFSLS
ncbi:undecaprenyl-diphosphate phosphatase [bacterium]|jgi:undecaprenyl-diphosphatase|nr:undecaprenyl-diphosphate phosphatase [bacterium]MBT4648990.1 undecaprenyl-diphosphate phosphatase [bacterium]